MLTHASQKRRESEYPDPCRKLRWLVALFLLIPPVSSPSQSPVIGQADAAPNLYEIRLSRLVHRSAVIFSGQVLNVERQPGPTLWTTVHFRIETAIKGASPGLFSANFFNDPASFPMQPGERVVLFLHAPNAGRLTSLVAGGCGLLERTGGDRVDLRRLQLCFAETRRTLADPVNAGPPRVPLFFTPNRIVEVPSPNTPDMPTGILLRLLEQLAREPPPIDREVTQMPVEAHAAP